MIHAVLLIASVFQGQSQPIPALPMGASTEFQKLCISIESSLNKGQFDEAAKLAVLLPKKEIVVSWNDSLVPAEFKEAYAEFRDLSFELWNKTIPGFKVKSGASGDIRIEFAKQLHPGASGLPMASVYMKDGPSVNFTIGLNRGRPVQSVSKELVYMEALYAVARYCGLSENPAPGTTMYRTDDPQRQVSGLSRPEMLTIARCLALSGALRKAVEEKRKVDVAVPERGLEKDEFDLGTVEQGAPLSFQFKIQNKGNGPLDFRLQPDCGCFTLPGPTSVEAGKTADFKIDISTIEFVGQHHKRLTLYTNDPDHPVQVIPVHFKVRPGYRMFRPGGDVVLLPDNGGSADVFLYFSTGTPATPLKAELNGVAGSVTMTPGEGDFADPLMGEPVTHRKGYRLHVKIGKDTPPGRPSGTINVLTDHPVFKNVSYTFYVQKGIVALPDNLYLGQISEPQYATTLVSRPGQPFDIKGIDSSNPNVSATFKMVKDRSEYSIRVYYDGKAPRGDMQATLHVRTSDPKQPIVEITVGGTVK